MKWNQTSEVTKVTALSLQQWQCSTHLHSWLNAFLVLYISWSCSKQFACKQPIWCTFQSCGHWEVSQSAFRNTGQPVSTAHPMALQMLPDTNHFCCCHSWNTALNGFTRSDSQGQVPVSRMAQANALASHLWKSKPDESFCSWSLMRT